MQPKTQKEGYIIQNFFAEFSKSKVIGRKIAATSIEGQQHIGITHPIQGLLIDNFCFDEGNQIQSLFKLKALESSFVWNSFKWKRRIPLN